LGIKVIILLLSPKIATPTPVKLKEPHVFNSNGAPVHSIVYSGGRGEMIMG